MCACVCLVCSVFLLGCGEKKDGGGRPAEPVSAELQDVMPEGLAVEAQAEWMLDRGRYAEALPLLEVVVEERREVGGLRYGEVLLSLGMVRDAQGDAAGALVLLSEAWALFEQDGAPAAMLGACADALGLAYQGAGEFADAEQAFHAAIGLRRLASPKSDEPWVSASQVHLGKLYLTLARYEEAGELLETALASAPDDASRATRLKHLGTYHHTIGSYVRAISRFEEALVLGRKIWGGESEQVASLLGDLGLSQLRAGELSAAEINLLASRDGIAALENVSPDLVLASKGNLAAFYLFQGELENAAGLLEGSGDAVALNNLGSAYHLAGNFREAAMALTKARALADSTLSEHHPLRVQILQNEACLLIDAGKNQAALERAREAGGAALDLLHHLLEFGSEGQKLDFRRTSDPLSQLCSFGASAEEIGEMVLQTKGVVLDSVLGGSSISERAPLPAGKIFIDYFVFQKYLGAGRWEQCYGAVLFGGEATRWVELGKGKELKAYLKDMRAHMDAEASGSKSDAVFSLEAVLEGLYDFCIAPLGEVGDGLIISPGGALSVVPFAALRHEGAFWCEGVRDVIFVTSGRPSANREVPAGKRWAQCGVASYSGAAVEWPGRGVGFGEELWKKISGLGDLPGVEREREVLVGVADFDSLPTDEFVLRRALQEPVRVLHFSCHGFFLNEGRRPMFRSGLVLGGARRSLVQMAIGEAPESSSDNVLFAGEVAELDLAGTELVTLAACDTGLGISVAGEGVLGLQRGFQIAGARNILMTLWAVEDQSLPEFLGRCYTKIRAGERASSAVWSTQAEGLREGAEKSLATAVWRAGAFTVLAQDAR